MLHLQIHKHGDSILCVGKTPKEYPWEGESDFPDVDISTDSWHILSDYLQYEATDNSILSFPDSTQMTVAEFRDVAISNPDVLQRACTS